VGVRGRAGLLRRRAAPGDASPGHVEVRYATRRGRDAADDDIAAFVASDRSPSDLCVVTSDAELSRRIRQAGAEVVGARWLLDRLDPRSSVDASASWAESESIDRASSWWAHLDRGQSALANGHSGEAPRGAVGPG
jgi:predicted RNA-binding protein with PIN domain